MATISTIVDDVLDTQVLTLRQRKQISYLLNGGDWTEGDINAVLKLVGALSSNKVFSAAPIH